MSSSLFMIMEKSSLRSGTTTLEKLAERTDPQSFFNGKVHRGDDEPAFCGYFEDGSINVKRWFVRGQLHRVDGPAIVVYYDNGKVSYQAWYQHGEIHHDDGPAFVKYDVFGEVAEKTWYNHGVPLS